MASGGKALELNPEQAVAALARLRFPDTFNPYADRCPKYDLADATKIRRSNLIATFEAAVAGVDSIWIALEPGHRGARRTGLAMTDDIHLAAHAQRWGIAGIARATRSGPETEQTAGIVWGALAGNRERVLLWNVFPLHCHLPGQPLSNRRHKRAEREACWNLTCAIIAMVRPGRIFAIGNDAHKAVSSLDHRCVRVRHPAYGGKADFLAGVAR
jgi:hypothetical protein